MYYEESHSMATTGELRAIIEQLQLVDIGDAASYLGEEEMMAEESLARGDAIISSVTLSLQDVTGNCIYCS